MNSFARLMIGFACLLLVWPPAFAVTNTLQVFSFDFGTAPSTHIDPTINAGDTVQWVWVNTDLMQHSTTAAAGQVENWDSGLQLMPFTFTHTFTHAGTFNYYCSLHGFDLGGGNVGGMSGHVVVLGATTDLTVTKFAPVTVALGGDLAYTITVANHATTNATNVALADALPDTAAFVSADTSQGTCTQIAGVVTCDLGNLDVSSVATVTVVVTAGQPGLLCNRATVTGDLGDTVTTNTSAQTCTTVQVHDLAVIAIKAPKIIALTATKASQTKLVRVTIQNRSAHSETIMDTGVLSNLVTLGLESIGTNCAAPVAPLVVGPPQKALPVILKPKQKFTATFSVTYDCANDPMKGAGHEDYRYIAGVHHEAIDGQPDSNPNDDGCPHDAIGGPFNDKGCGAKNPDGTLGAPVTTDVTVK